jgi:hypothetical protein
MPTPRLAEKFRTEALKHDMEVILTRYCKTHE